MFLAANKAAKVVMEKESSDLAKRRVTEISEMAILVNTGHGKSEYVGEGSSGRIWVS